MFNDFRAVQPSVWAAFLCRDWFWMMLADKLTKKNP